MCKKNVTKGFTSCSQATHISLTPTDFCTHTVWLCHILAVRTYLLLSNVFHFIRRSYTPNPAHWARAKLNPIALCLMTHIYFSPTPELYKYFELHLQVSALTSALTAGIWIAGTTWLFLTNAPDALLYGSLVEAATFPEDPLKKLHNTNNDSAPCSGCFEKVWAKGYGARDESRYDI